MFPTFWIYCSPIFWWNNTRKLCYLTRYLNSANKLFHLTNEKFLRRMFDKDTIPLLPKITRIKLIFYQFADPEKKIQKRTHLFAPKKKKAQSLFPPNPINSKPSFHCCKTLHSRSAPPFHPRQANQLCVRSSFACLIEKLTVDRWKKTRYKNQFRL